MNPLLSAMKIIHWSHFVNLDFHFGLGQNSYGRFCHRQKLNKYNLENEEKSK